MVSPKARRILFPIDRSDHSKRAIQWYLDRFAWENDALYLVHVVEPNYSRRFSEVSPDDHTSALTNKMKESVAAGEQVGAQYRSFLKERGKESEFVMQVGTKPGEQIINAARDLSADVIIIGNRGVGTIRRTVLGSVSDYVFHNSSIPVILVPPTVS
ncbi:Universal stress protein Sll1654 [Clonorchis sinensis]|uniref:Universal stress protein Sll1654 n=1 Tax=Clonorchis sinensis TaxID=79923 RepID=A0A419PS71_CLOSI|nr:Universal stress protein Sll1654 [Clonorchis sinensis]